LKDETNKFNIFLKSPFKRYRSSKDKKKTQGNPCYFQRDRKIPSRVKKNTKRRNKKKDIKKRNEKNQANSSEPLNS